MKISKIIQLLTEHGVYFQFNAGCLLVLESYDMISHIDNFVDVTNYTKQELFDFLGYE